MLAMLGMACLQRLMRSPSTENSISRFGILRMVVWRYHDSHLAVADELWGGWGNVAIDGDVVPASQAHTVHGDSKRNNKRHHFLAVTYMTGFQNENGRVWVYRPEAPTEPDPVTPASVGFENFYYSQKLPDGTQEKHRFEDLWNAIETVWPNTIRAVNAGRLSPAISFNLLGMAALSRVRVPAAREKNEILLATKLRAEVQALEKIGKLPGELKRYAGELDRVPVGVNPQQTLMAMMNGFKAFGDLCFQIGFEILHNASAVPFLTSDNPVCVYDARKALHARRPYEYEDEVELIFPLTATSLLRGSPRLRPVNQVVRHRTLHERSAIRRLNRTIAQFSYRFLLAQDRSSDDFAKLYAKSVPTVDVKVREVGKEIQIIYRHVFGKRPALSQFIDTPEKAARLEAKMAAAPPAVGGH
jgi:hypothetical protein